MVKITKEKINFGIITVNDIGELSFNLKIDYFPAFLIQVSGCYNVNCYGTSDKPFIGNFYVWCIFGFPHCAII